MHTHMLVDCLLRHTSEIAPNRIVRYFAYKDMQYAEGFRLLQANKVVRRQHS